MVKVAEHHSNLTICTLVDINDCLFDFCFFFCVRVIMFLCICKGDALQVVVMEKYICVSNNLGECINEVYAIV